MYGAIASSRNAMAAAGHASRADQAIAIVQLYGRALRRSSLGVKLLTWHACRSCSSVSSTRAHAMCRNATSSASENCGPSKDAGIPMATCARAWGTYDEGSHRDRRRSSLASHGPGAPTRSAAVAPPLRHNRLGAALADPRCSSFCTMLGLERAATPLPQSPASARRGRGAAAHAAQPSGRRVKLAPVHTHRGRLREIERYQRRLREHRRAPARA